MDLFKYFKQEGKCDYLLDPHGPLNKQVSSSSIEEANKEADSCCIDYIDSGVYLQWTEAFSLQFCNTRKETQG